jgi:hypothetical protein
MRPEGRTTSVQSAEVFIERRGSSAPARRRQAASGKRWQASALQARLLTLAPWLRASCRSTHITRVREIEAREKFSSSVRGGVNRKMAPMELSPRAIPS